MSIDVLNTLPLAQSDSSSFIDQSITDWYIIFSKIPLRSRFFMSSWSLACVWLEMINRLDVLMSWEAQLNSLKVSTPITYDWVTGIETCEKELHELYHRLRNVTFLLDNISVSYVWHLYSSNFSSMYFLYNATRLASIFSSFTTHNALFWSVTYKWQSFP